MKRLTTDAPKNNLESALNLFYAVLFLEAVFVLHGNEIMTTDFRQPNRCRDPWGELLAIGIADDLAAILVSVDDIPDCLVVKNDRTWYK